jgi:hypothetical protein
MKSRAASNWVSCFRGPRALRASSRPSTSVSRKPLQVGYPEASEFFGIPLARFRPPVEVALQQAAPAVVRIDLGVPRPVHRPGGLRGVLQDDFVDHAHSLQRPNPVAANSRLSGKFPVFPDPRRRAGQDARARSRAGRRRCRRWLRPALVEVRRAGGPCAVDALDRSCPFHLRLGRLASMKLPSALQALDQRLRGDVDIRNA